MKQKINIKKDNWKRSLRIWKLCFEKCPSRFLSSLASAFISALSPYASLYLSAQIINELTGERNPQTLTVLVFLMLGCTALCSLLSGAAQRWNDYSRSEYSLMMDKLYMEKGFDMDFVDLDSQHTYDLLSQIRQNMQYWGWGIRVVLHCFDNLLSNLLSIVGGIALTVTLFTQNVPAGNPMEFLNNPLFSLAMIALMFLISWLASLCASKGMAYWANQTNQSEEVKLGNRIFGFFSGASHIESYRALDYRIYEQEKNIASPSIAKITFFSVHSEFAKTARGPMGFLIAASASISMILTGMIYLFVCLKAWGGAFGVGSVTQYVGAITQCFLGISHLLENMESVQTNAPFLEPICEFLDIPNTMFQGSLTTEKRNDRQYDIEFKDVSFKYPGSDTYALRHVNMKFKVGSRLAVVGMNGSGKTTFIKLLCRLYDPSEGQILLNGIDIRKYKYDDYIQIFSVVFQDFKLFALPLGQNVAGSADYDRERVLNCLKDAGFDERIKSLKHGLDTYLYKDLDVEGVNVSGGEAQKIAIARALYKDAPFIILDEPTAALDPIAEAEIYSKFDEIVTDKTAIYISHRLSSCKFCDTIAVFHEGTVIQQGSHETLVADTDGKYYELWNAQAQYYT